MLSVLGLLGEGDREDEEEIWWWWRPRERDGWGEEQSRDGWRDWRWWEEDRRGGDGEGRPAGLLVMPAPKDRREGAGLLRYLRGGDGEGEESRRQWPWEREVQGRWGRWERCRPSDELLSLDLARSRRERLAVVDRWRLGEESGDVWERRSRRRARSPEDLSRELLWWRESLPARFVPDLCWARDASRSPEGLSCRSALEPMFPWGTAGPTVDWGGASPCNCCQYSLMSSKNWAFQSWTISCVGPRETFPSVCGVVGRAVTVVLVVDAIGTKGGVAPGKNPRKRGGGRNSVFKLRRGRRRRQRRKRSCSRRSTSQGCRSRKTYRARRGRERSGTTDLQRSYGRAPSGPSPRWRWRSVARRRQRHAYPGHLNLRMCSPGSVHEPWKRHWQAGARRR